MKILAKYFKSRENSINAILHKSSDKYNAETFHKLRVEIKKINALFELIKFCSEDFHHKKTFKPFKVLFRQAGKVRELQVEETILKKKFEPELLRTYRKDLNNRKQTEKKKFFSIADKKIFDRLNKKFHKIHLILSQLKKNKTKAYFEKKRRKIAKLLAKFPLQPAEMHALRKQLKKFNYNKKATGAAGTLFIKDNLTDLVGKWHDCTVIINNLEKAIYSGKIITVEIKHIKKIKSGLNKEAGILFKKIGKEIRRSAHLKRKN